MNLSKIAKSTLRLSVLGACLGNFARVAVAHDPTESRVEIDFQDTNKFSAGTVTIPFQLLDTKLEKVIADADLTVTSEKILHTFVYDEGLKEFRHVHPEFKNGFWSVTTDLPVGGNYWIWMQGELTVDGTEFVSGTPMKVLGGLPASPMPPVLGDQRSGTSDISAVTLSKDVLKANQMVMPILTFSRTDGTKPNLSPYLGQMAHFTIVSDDADTLIHCHPMTTSDPNRLMMHTTFPRAGDYRVWVQFVDGGILKVVALSVTVVQ